MVSVISFAIRDLRYIVHNIYIFNAGDRGVWLDNRPWMITTRRGAQAYSIMWYQATCFPDEDVSLHPSNNDLLASSARLEFRTILSVPHFLCRRIWECLDALCNRYAGSTSYVPSRGLSIKAFWDLISAVYHTPQASIYQNYRHWYQFQSAKT